MVALLKRLIRWCSVLFRKLCRVAPLVVGKVGVVAVVLLLLCEYVVYPVVLFRCSWPTFTPKNGISRENETLRAMFLADTHLLGPFRGHWLDKLRREWQMHRAFQTGMSLFEPEVVFFLGKTLRIFPPDFSGDVFDEGNWVNDQGFTDYVNRFKELFSVNGNGKTRSFVVTGNHDMGFHYEIIPYLHGRFNRAFNTTSVRLLRLKGSKFLLINSMAMEMDGCFLCAAAKKSLEKVSESLQCEEDPTTCRVPKHSSENSDVYSAPILLQHFPLYRPSDATCTGEDATPEVEKKIRFREKHHCLTKESSQFLLKSIKPRLILSGHTHHHCIMEHQVVNGPPGKSVLEYSVPSFSWRNRNDPSFYLAIFTPDEYHLSKCYMPKESTVLAMYALGVIFLLIWLLWPCFRNKCSRFPFVRRLERQPCSNERRNQ